jgi:hypothetical protein
VSTNAAGMTEVVGGLSEQALGLGPPLVIQPFLGQSNHAPCEASKRLAGAAVGPCLLGHADAGLHARAEVGHHVTGRIMIQIQRP